MFTKTKFALLSFAAVFCFAVFAQTAEQNLEDTDDAQLRLQEHYREWIYLRFGI